MISDPTGGCLGTFFGPVFFRVCLAYWTPLWYARRHRQTVAAAVVLCYISLLPLLQCAVQGHPGEEERFRRHSVASCRAAWSPTPHHHAISHLVLRHIHVLMNLHAGFVVSGTHGGPRKQKAGFHHRRFRQQGMSIPWTPPAVGYWLEVVCVPKFSEGQQESTLATSVDRSGTDNRVLLR